MRDEIEIPASYGARVFVNQSGGVTIRQHQVDEEVAVMFTPEEAQQVAAALNEVAGTAMAQQAEPELGGIAAPSTRTA